MTARMSLYHQMLRHSHDHAYYLWPDGLVTPGTSRPTREELIRDFMSIPCRVARRRTNGPGHDQSEDVTYASLEEAERAVSRFAPQITEEIKEQEAA